MRLTRKELAALEASPPSRGKKPWKLGAWPEIFRLARIGHAIEEQAMGEPSTPAEGPGEGGGA
uniref:Uncharacterized protein n=1 Tax=viral metagenome TaxID=1070528 RepID=A0A6M3X6Y6_9ZZZZ